MKYQKGFKQLIMIKIFTSVMVRIPKQGWIEGCLSMCYEELLKKD